MIERLVHLLFWWTPLRYAIVAEVHLYDHLESILSDKDGMETASLSWMEGDTWYGWTRDSNTGRYYFDDIGNKSIIGLLESHDTWERNRESL